MITTPSSRRVYPWADTITHELVHLGYRGSPPIALRLAARRHRQAARALVASEDRPTRYPARARCERPKRITSCSRSINAPRSRCWPRGRRDPRLRRVPSSWRHGRRYCKARCQRPSRRQGDMHASRRQGRRQRFRVIESGARGHQGLRARLERIREHARLVQAARTRPREYDVSRLPRATMAWAVVGPRSA